MLAFLAVLLLVFVFWIMYGRGALIVYKYKEDNGVTLPDGMDKDQLCEFLKKSLSYPDAKEIYFDEDGDICIECKYDTHVVSVFEGKAYVNDAMYENAGAFDGGNKAVTFLANLGYWKIRFKRKNQKRIEEIECLRSYLVKALNHDAPINAHQKYTNFKNARKYTNIISAVAAALAVILVIAAFSSGLGNQKINGVKYAYLNAYSTEITINEAFNDFFDDPTWESYTENSEDYVKFTGECTFKGRPALMVITFEFMENDWFRVSNIKLNGETLSEYEEDAVLEKIFESYGD